MNLKPPKLYELISSMKKQSIDVRINRDELFGKIVDFLRSKGAKKISIFGSYIR